MDAVNFCRTVYPMSFFSQIINGLSVGSIYALVALGYSMVYGIVKLINFAHGDVIMFGAYTVFVTLVLSGLPLWISILLAVVLTALCGVLIERLAYRRLLDAGAPRISLLITALGVSMLLQNLSQIVFSSSAKAMPSLIPSQTVNVLGAPVSMVTIITILTMIAVMIGLTALINRTKVGKAMRAVSEDADAAKLMGIHTGRTVAFTFAVGSALAAVAAVLYIATYRQISPFMGSMLGLKAFVAAVLGGIGSVPGAMVGGLIMGVVESLTKGYISSTMADAVVFGILIIVLLFKPAGIMGKQIREKV